MEASAEQVQSGKFLKLSVEAAIRIGVLALIFIWSLQIIRPFVEIVLWAIILAVAIYPLYTGLARRLGGRTKVAAFLITIAALAVLLVPSWKFFGATVDEARDVSQKAEAGTLQVPPPPDGVKDWPLIGERTYAFWYGASRNLEATAERLKPELASFGKWALGSLAGLAGTVLQFFVSILIAGVLLSTGKQGHVFSVKFATRLAGPRSRSSWMSMGSIRASLAITAAFSAVPPMPIPSMPGGHQPAPMVGTVLTTQSTILSEGLSITILDLFSAP